jgi:hypothetical protein
MSASSSGDVCAKTTAPDAILEMEDLAGSPAMGADPLSSERLAPRDIIVCWPSGLRRVCIGSPTNMFAQVLSSELVEPSTVSSPTSSRSGAPARRRRTASGRDRADAAPRSIGF